MLLNPPSKTSSPASYSEKSVVVLSTKLDGVNLFENAEIGAESPSTGKLMLKLTSFTLFDPPLVQQSFLFPLGSNSFKLRGQS